MEQPNNRTVFVKIKRGDLIAVMIAVSIVIKAAYRDQLPNERIQHGYNVLARALMEHDSKEEKRKEGRDAKKDKHKQD